MTASILKKNQNPKVFIILVNYNSWQHTIECIESLLRSDYENISIIVVDNKSTDNSVDYVTKWAEGELSLWRPPQDRMRSYSIPPVQKPTSYLSIKVEQIKNKLPESKITLVEAPKNGGFSYGNNLALEIVKGKIVQGDYVWFLNNDTVVEVDSLTKLIEFSEQYSDQKLAIGAKTLVFGHENRIDCEGWGYLNLFSAKVKHTDFKVPFTFKYIVGSSILLNHVNMMCEEYFLYFEDIEYSKDLLNKGYELKYCKDCRVYHKVNGSTTNNPSMKTIKLRSMAIFYRRNYPFLLPLILILRSLFYFFFFNYRLGLFTLKLLFTKVK